MQVYNYLFGTRLGAPVQMFLNIGVGMVDLVKIPVDEYNKVKMAGKIKIIHKKF